MKSVSQLASIFVLFFGLFFSLIFLTGLSLLSLITDRADTARQDILANPYLQPELAYQPAHA